MLGPKNVPKNFLSYIDPFDNCALCVDHYSRVRRYGYAMLAPILLMTIFSLRQWWRLEKSWNRLWTLPLVLLQCFPQYRALRILYLGLRKKASWRAEKDIYVRDLTSLGMYVCFNVLLIQ